MQLHLWWICIRMYSVHTQTFYLSKICRKLNKLLFNATESGVLTIFTISMFCTHVLVLHQGHHTFIEFTKKKSGKEKFKMFFDHYLMNTDFSRYLFMWIYINISIICYRDLPILFSQTHAESHSARFFSIHTYAVPLYQ